jgi:hypothetical protein
MIAIKWENARSIENLKNYLSRSQKGTQPSQFLAVSTEEECFSSKMIQLVNCSYQERAATTEFFREQWNT